MHNEQLHNLYNLCSKANIIRAIKSRKSWVMHVARMRDKKCIQNCCRKRWTEETIW